MAIALSVGVAVRNFHLCKWPRFGTSLHRLGTGSLGNTRIFQRARSSVSEAFTPGATYDAALCGSMDAATTLMTQHPLICAETHLDACGGFHVDDVSFY